MKYLKELLILKNLPKVGNAKINNSLKGLIKADTSIEDLTKALQSNGFSLYDINSAVANADEIVKQIETHPEYDAITVFDEDYPIRLNDLGASKPIILYTYGNKEAFSGQSLGIIGTRHPSEHVTKYAPNLIKLSIEKMHPVIVSGLAIGCDTIGHKTALDENALTIAVLPCGFNSTTKGKLKLCKEIVEKNGLIISEYFFNEAETRFTPVQRDAIIAALSDKVISLQCGTKSGTMHTIEIAYKMHRPIGCYIPSVKEGDFEGHDEAINNYAAKGIKSESDLDAFLFEENKIQADEQLCLF